jgi:pimeloyl-ACP methyl ester carboxylesterase
MAQASRSATQHGRYARANGLKIFYEARGSGPPLILLHGGTATSSMRQPQIPFFVQHFRVITASHLSATGKLFTETVLDFLLRHSTTAAHRE